MNIYESMGLEWLLDDNVWNQLNEHITENTRYVVPGYKYNYRLCTFPGFTEFTRCEQLDGTPIKTDIHFASEDQWSLEVCNAISTASTAHFYNLKSKNGEHIPVRVVCPDVLPSVKNGDMLEGQVVAFADSIIKMPADVTADGGIHPDSNNCVFINGVITDVTSDSFEFCNTGSSFLKIDLKTENGSIIVLISENAVCFTPEIDDVISVHAMISMDVAIEHELSKDAAFYKDPYKGIIADSDKVKYKNGFLPDFHRDQRALINSIETGDFSRFQRCCAETVEFVSNKGEKRVISRKDRDGIADELKAALPDKAERVEVKHFLSCENERRIGHDAIVVSSGEGAELVIWFDIDEAGTVSRIEFFDSDKCSLGIDYGLHLNAMFSHATCDRKWYILHEYITHGCMYRSEYADVCLIGSENIVKRCADISERLDDTDVYTYKFSYTKDELIRVDDLPLICRCERCTVNYYAGDLAYVAFLKLNEENKITDILLSRDKDYLKLFGTEKTSNKKTKSDVKSVFGIISSVYGNDDTIEVMRKNEIPDQDANDVYVWKKADEFAASWLKDNGYKVSETVLIDDCIGYACERKGVSYAVFLYAYGEEKTVGLDGKYCAKLRKEIIAQGRDIIVLYLHVDKKINGDGLFEYTVGSFHGSDSKIEPWLLTTVMGKSILRYYPSKEMMDLIPRLISAYNTMNLDALKALFSNDVYLESFEYDGQSMNDGFYTHLSSIHKHHGKMKLAYIRFNDVVFSAVPYIENYAYVNFIVKDEINGLKIDGLQMNSLGNSFREFIITDEDFDYCAANIVPSLSKVEFMKPTESSRFSLRLSFENGEIRQYNLTAESGRGIELNENGELVENVDFIGDEIVKFQGKVMTDKIFSNGRISSHIPMPGHRFYRGYAERGQGVEFITGAAISTVELYHNSYPVEKFSYAGMDNVHVMQMNYDEDGFGVGYIPDMDPKNPLYLLDSNTMTATVLPDEYQATPIGIYPFYGGYSEGLIMVSRLGELVLQYHHNQHSCAGLWGWLDREMNVVIEPKYIYAMNFIGGRAIVCKGDWNVKITKEGKEEYWCDNEQWGVIDKSETEIVPCRFDELYEIENTDRLFFVHEGGWENGHYAVFDTEAGEVILVLDFDFDIGYMFNECFVTDDNILVFDDHLPGKEKDWIYAYDLINKRYIAHGEPLEGRTYNGETRSVVKKDGKDIIIF